MWRALRNRALAAFKFRRQHPVGRYFLDFACVACKLAVEIDGVSHLDASAKDAERSAFLEAEGWLVLRFWNTQVYDEIDAVRDAIYRECVRRQKP
jgi:very-short-patch-repair endonuclease